MLRRRRLAEVQTLLAKEVVLWNHGYLAMPQVQLRYPGFAAHHVILAMALPCQDDIVLSKRFRVPAQHMILQSTREG